MADSHATLGREDEFVAASLEPAAEDFFGSPRGFRGRWNGVNVGAIQEGDAMRCGLVKDIEGRAFVGLVAKGHGAKTDFRYFEPCTAKPANLHEYSSRK
jgi:hypothetical protein